MEGKLKESVYTYIFLVVIISVAWVCLIPNIIVFMIIFVAAIITILAVLKNAQMTQDRIDVKLQDRKL